MDKYGIVGLCSILTFVFLISYCLLNYRKSAEAKPVTTEVPEYIAKCSKTSFNRNNCTEFTIYRITRN